VIRVEVDAEDVRIQVADDVEQLLGRVERWSRID
jgi:hypothetical protein